jgi:hypothetical protein
MSKAELIAWVQNEARAAFPCTGWLTPALFCGNNADPPSVFGIDLSAERGIDSKIVQMQEKYRHVVHVCIAEIVDTAGLKAELDLLPSPWPNCWPRPGPENERRQALLDKCPVRKAAVILCYSKDGNEAWEAPIVEVTGEPTLGEWVKREDRRLPGESMREYFKLLPRGDRRNVDQPETGGDKCEN